MTNKIQNSKSRNLIFNHLKFICYLSFGIWIFAASAANAADLYFITKADKIYTDDVFVAEARMRSPDLAINVAEGSIMFDKNKLEVKELSSGGSLFALWAQEPSFSNSAGTISFVGGTPAGFQGDGLILKAIFTAKETGETRLSFLDDFSLYLADGKGTKIKPQIRPLALTIYDRSPEIQPKNEWEEFIAEDTFPPKFIEAIISRDPHLFGNKYFASFFAEDDGSGVSYYEIKEGEPDFVRAVSPYVLKDQSLSGVVQIKAVDAAGNEAVITAEVAPEKEIPATKYLIWIFLLLVLIVAVFVLRRRQ